MLLELEESNPASVVVMKQDRIATAKVTNVGVEAIMQCCSADSRKWL